MITLAVIEFVAIVVTVLIWAFLMEMTEPKGKRFYENNFEANKRLGGIGKLVWLLIFAMVFSLVFGKIIMYL